MDKQCLICDTALDPNSPREHILPSAIGGGLTIDSICKSCNHKMGDRVDHYLVDHWLVKYMRCTYGLKSKNGDLPNPLDNSYNSDNPEQEILVDPESEEKYLFPFQCETEWKEPTEDDPYLEVWAQGGPDLEEKFEEVVNGQRKKFGMDPVDIEDIEDDMVTIELENLNVTTEVMFDLERFKIAMIKIAFEYAYSLLGEEYRYDPLFGTYQNALNQHVHNGEFYEKWQEDPHTPWSIKGEIQVTTGRTILPKQLRRLIPRYHRHSHVIYTPKINGSTYCYISIFGGLEAILEISRKIHPSEDHYNSPYFESPPDKPMKKKRLGTILDGDKLILVPSPRRIFQQSGYWYTPDSETLSSTNIRLTTEKVTVPD